MLNLFGHQVEAVDTILFVLFVLGAEYIFFAEAYITIGESGVIDNPKKAAFIFSIIQFILVGLWILWG
jgi:hypothetical protein